MFAHPMHGSAVLTLFWIWMGIVAVAAVAYWALRARLNKARKPPAPPVKYAEQLRQRLRDQPSRPTAAPSHSAGPHRKPPPTPQ